MDDQNQQLNRVYNTLISILNNADQYDDIHEQILKDLLDKHGNKILKQNLSLSEIHAIDCIGKNRLPNATFVAQELKMTKGAISKITAKLTQKGFIKGNQLGNNKKDIYYTLTPQGKAIFEIHAKVHNVIKEKIISILTKYNKNELRLLSSFLEDFLKEYFMISTL